MKTISLEIPEALLWQTGESAEQLRARAQFLLALKLFELGQMTSGQARTFPVSAVWSFFSKRVSTESPSRI